MYEEVSGLVTSALDGYNVVLFTYGQTGSGKVRATWVFVKTRSCLHFLTSYLLVWLIPCIAIHYADAHPPGDGDGRDARHDPTVHRAGRGPQDGDRSGRLVVPHGGVVPRGPDSRIIDIGSGRGKPSLHAALYARVKFSFGIELDPCRVYLANIILKNIIKKARKNTDLSTITNVSYQLGDISEALSLDPFTHVWMFDVA